MCHYRIINQYQMCCYRIINHLSCSVVLMSLKGRNASATALRWFAGDTAHNVFIDIPSVMKPVQIFMARNRVCKSCLMVELCFHRFVHFDSVLIYIFGFHHKQCASDQKDFTFVKFISQLFSSTDESLKDETCLVLLLHIL